MSTSTKPFTLLTVFFLVFAMAASSQTELNAAKSKRMSVQKANGLLSGHELLINPSPSALKITPITPHAATEECDCWVTRDSTWSVVPFDCSGASGGPGLPPEYRNDDWSACVHLPFSFCFYGQQVDSVFINNNGNLSIGAPYSTYTATSFPSNQYTMIAPFWSDVDSRNPTSGLVYYQLHNSHLVIQWDSVDYFDSDTTFNPTHLSLYNTYQLIITDGVDPLVQFGQNVSFCYRNMNWTTGDASSGTNGFGGVPATVGVNQGNGVDYFQIGLYSDSTTAWDGPYGLDDGVYSLTNQSFTFNVCNTSSNTPPIALLSALNVCDTVTLCDGDTAIFNAGFLSPESGQITTLVLDTIGIHGVTVLSDSSANVAGISIQLIAQAANAGFHTLRIIATDNGSPPLTTITSILINIINCTLGVPDVRSGNEQLVISPNPVSDLLTVISPKHSGACKMEICNALGSVVKTLVLTGVQDSTVHLSISDLNAGVYFVRFSSDETSVLARFVKE